MRHKQNNPKNDENATIPNFVAYTNQRESSRPSWVPHIARSVTRDFILIRLQRDFISYIKQFIEIGLVWIVFTIITLICYQVGTGTTTSFTWRGVEIIISSATIMTIVIVLAHSFFSPSKRE